MGVNYTALEATATRLLRDNGQAITFSYETGEVINPATGTVTTPASESTVSGYGVASNYKNAEIDGQSVLASDLKLLASNVATEPKANWKVGVNGKTWRVMQVMPINPAGTNVMYICQIRI
jgi:hypothetical protein